MCTVYALTLAICRLDKEIIICSHSLLHTRFCSLSREVIFPFLGKNCTHACHINSTLYSNQLAGEAKGCVIPIYNTKGQTGTHPPSPIAQLKYNGIMGTLKDCISTRSSTIILLHSLSLFCIYPVNERLSYRAGETCNFSTLCSAGIDFWI